MHHVGVCLWKNALDCHLAAVSERITHPHPAKLLYVEWFQANIIMGHCMLTLIELLKDRKAENSAVHQLLVQIAMDEYRGGTPRWWLGGCVHINKFPILLT